MFFSVIRFTTDTVQQFQSFLQSTQELKQIPGIIIGKVIVLGCFRILIFVSRLIDALLQFHSIFT